MTVCLLFLIGATVQTSEAVSTFIGSTVLSMDQAQRTITFRTKEGQSWTLPVADPNILKKEQVTTGDQVSIELDPNDRVTKIIKLSEQPRSERPQLGDDLRP